METILPFTGLTVISFVLGLIIGSFLNVVIYRLEKEESLNGRSYCPHCKHQLNWKDLFPVLSFIYLSGKCRYCHQKISWQYPLVELSTGLLFLAICVANFSDAFSLLHILCLWYITSALVVIFVYDLKHFLIPDSVLFPAIIILFLYQLLFMPQFLFFSSLWAALTLAIFFGALYLGSRGTWIGFGDVKLALLLGLLLGFSQMLVGMFLAFVSGAIFGVIVLVLKSKGLKSEIPFAPFLIGGTFLSLFFGQMIIHWYLGFFLLA